MTQEGGPDPIDTKREFMERARAIGGRHRAFWKRNPGLAIPGVPIVAVGFLLFYPWMTVGATVVIGGVSYAIYKRLPEGFKEEARRHVENVTNRIRDNRFMRIGTTLAERLGLTKMGKKIVRGTKKTVKNTLDTFSVHSLGAVLGLKYGMEDIWKSIFSRKVEPKTSNRVTTEIP